MKANNLPGGAKRVTNDPMEATYVGIHMWKQAVEKAKSTDVDKVRVAMIGQTVAAPSGFTLAMDGNHHLHKPVMIGEIRGDGQFNVVWKMGPRCARNRGPRSSQATGQAGHRQLDSGVPAPAARGARLMPGGASRFTRDVPLARRCRTRCAGPLP